MDLANRKNRQPSAEMSRRRFLKVGVLAAWTGLLSWPCFAGRARGAQEERTLWFYNTHTDETLKTVYRIDGKYVPSALKDIDYILRDHRSGESTLIDTRLLELLHAIAEEVDAKHPFHIISGYRSPKTNAMLRKNGRGVAKGSYHMYGKAADIRLPGCSLGVLRDAALGLKSGGVGYYPSSDFIHVDVGPVRRW
jgi:uncharacterized protein YcbK (DUF882 family)